MAVTLVILSVLSLSTFALAEAESPEVEQLRAQVHELRRQLDAMRHENADLTNRLNETDKRLDGASAAIADMRTQVASEGTTIEAMGKRLAEGATAIDTAGTRLVAAEAEARRLAERQRRSSVRSSIVAFILLVGLIVEVIGALLLAGPALTSKQEVVTSLGATPPLQDLAVRDVNLEPKMNFLGSLGALFLLGGFLLQYLGTMIALSTPWELDVALVLVGTLIGGGLLSFLLGRTHGQTKWEKLAVIRGNVRRNLPRFGRGSACDYCAHRVLPGEAQVWWREQENSPPHSYLYEPHDWHFGHAACLEGSGWYKRHDGGPMMADNRQTHRVAVAEFLRTEVPRYEEWWEQAATRSARARPGKPFHGAHEDEFRRALAKARICGGGRLVKGPLAGTISP